MTMRGILLGAAGLVMACGEGGGTTDTKPAVARVEVAPPTQSITVGGTATLTATARDAAGAVLTGKTAVWTASPGSVATVTQAGVVSGVAPGSAVVSAAIDGVSGNAAITVTAPLPSLSVSVIPTPMLVAVGGTAILTANVRDQNGLPIPGRTFSFRSSDETIATVSDGVVTGIRAGVVTLTATSQEIAGSTLATVVSPTTLAGRVLPADGGSPTGLRFYALTGTGAGTQMFATTIDATGAFSFSAPLGPLPTDSVDVVVDVPIGPRTYRPVDARVPAARGAVVAARPLLIPRTSVFTSPTYGSTSLEVSLQQAFTRVCSDDTNANCNSFFPQVWRTVVPLWAESDLPVPLAFNYTATTSPITATDSIALWTVIRQMEADIGRPLFKPATFTDLTPPDMNGYSPKAVLVWVDKTLSGFAGYTNWNWDGSQNMFAAKTRVTTNALLGNRPLMTHELLHALGFHHTCAWPTVMGGYGCSSQQGATKADVAAFHLGYAARRTIVANAPTTTFRDALRGEQLFDAVTAATAPTAQLSIRAPFAAATRRTMVVGGRLVTSDGAP